MTWARPDLLALLLLVPLVLAGVVLAERARRRMLGRLASPELLRSLLGPRVARARGLQAGLSVVAALALTTAAAGPRLGFDWQQQSVEGVSLVVLLDVSRSMDAADVVPSRLERARREITDLTGLLRGDAVGLVLFAAGPYVRIPLTVDYDTFLWAVQDSSSETIRAQGTSLAGALEASTTLLEKASGSSKAILLVSDGEGHDAGAELESALERTRAAGIRIYTLGVGDLSGAPIPLEGGGFKKDSSGEVVLSRLDEEALRRLAAATGGAYVRAVPSEDDVRALYQDEIRGKLDAEERGVRREKVWRERFQWPLAVGLVALGLSAGLGVGRSGRRRFLRSTVGLLLAFVLLQAPAAHAGSREEGLSALRSQEWVRAAERLGQARVENPSDVGVSQGLAEALYRLGRYREAEQLFRTLAETDDASRRAVHLYNAGNAAYRSGRLTDALRDFRESAAADPQLKPAQNNAAAVEREIAARMQTPPPTPPPSSQSGGGTASENSGESDESSQAAENASQDMPNGKDGSAGAAGQPPEAGTQSQASNSPPAGSGGSPSAADTPKGQTPSTAAPPGENDGRLDPSDQAEAADPSMAEQASGASGAELSSADGDSVTADSASDDTPPGAMTAEQAARLVDAIPDGRPRVIVGGSGTEKDW